MTRRGEKSGWFDRPGRRPLAIGLVGLALLVALLPMTVSVQRTNWALTSRGVSAPALVESVQLGQTKQGAPEVEELRVRFAVGSAVITDDTYSTSGLSTALTVGAPVTVVYDPEHPRRFLLENQLHNGDAVNGWLVVAGAAVVAVVGIGWWAFVFEDRRNWRPRSIGDTGESDEPDGPWRITKLGHDGEEVEIARFVDEETARAVLSGLQNNAKHMRYSLEFVTL